MCDLIITKSVDCEDAEEVVSLEVEVIPEEYSESLQEYVRSKQQQHEDLLENMKTDLEAVNLTSDEELKDITEILNEELQLLDAEMSGWFSQDLSEVEQLNVLLGNINKREIQIRKILKEFNLDLIHLEKTRCENIKKVLGQQKEKLIQIGFLSLENIEQIFEVIIADLNSNTLINLRNYEDKKLRFRVDGDTIISKYRLALRDRANGLADGQSYELWEEVKKKQVNMLVSEVILNLTKENSKTNEDFAQAINSLIESLHDLSRFLEYAEPEDKKGEFWENLMKELELKFETINTCFLNVEELLKLAITNHTITFDEAKISVVQRLRADFGDEENGNDFSSELAILNNEKEKQFDKLQNWQKVFNKWAISLNKTQHFSMDIISFWQHNIDCLNKVRLNLEANSESCYQKCLKKERELNKQIKNQMKAVREAPDKIKLESFSKGIKETLKSLANTWIENFEQNIETIEEVKNKNTTQLIKDTIDEANQLLFEKYPKTSWFSDSNFAELNLDQNDVCFPIFTVNDYIDDIEKKAYDMYEKLGKYVNIREENITKECESLCKRFIMDGNKKRKSIIDELTSKNTNVEEMRNLRLAELEIHSERLISHPAAVDVILSDLRKVYEEIKSNQNLKLKEFQDKLSNIEETCQIETWNEINSVISELEQEWNSLSIVLENRILDEKMICQHKFETLKHSNDSFKKIATIFKKGGNYSPNELKTLNKELKKLEKSFLNQSKTLTNQYNSLLKDISRQELDHVIKMLRDKLNVVSLKDKTEEMLRVTRLKLRNEINEMKSLERTFNSKIHHLTSLEQLDCNLLDDIVSLGYSILDNMAYSLPLEYEQKTRLSTNQSQSNKSLRTNRNKAPKNIVTAKSLFDNVTDEELSTGINFLSRVKLILSERFSAISQNIQDTLRPKSVDVAKSKKKDPKHDAKTGAMTEKIELVWQVLHSYNNECEMLRFDQARRFISQLTFLRLLTENFTEKMLSETHSTHVRSLTSIESEFKNGILKISTEGACEINKLRKSLVLTLAHPHYQHKIEKMYEQAKSVTASKTKAYNEFISSYQDDLQKKHDDYVEKVTLLKETLENCQATVFDTISCDDLAVKLQELEILILDHENKVEKTDTDENRDEIRKETEKIESPPYPLSVWADDITDDPESMSEIPVSQPVEKNCIITKAALQLKESVKKIQKLFEDAEYEAKIFEKEIAKCMRNLEYDIKQAKLVYTEICN